MPQFMKFRRIIQNGQTVFRLKGSPIGNLFLGESWVKKINLQLSILVKNNMFIKEKRGYSSAGRALEWHSRGQRFDPAYLHNDKYGTKSLIIWSKYSV